MSGNSTSFYLNLAGNISSQASRFARDISQFSNSATAKMGKLSVRIRETSSHLKGLGSTISGISGKINSIGNMTIPILGVGAAAGMATVGKSMLRTAADFEMADIRMKQTFKERGDEATAWLKQFATDTPMAFGEVQDAMMRLQTAGIDPMGGSLQALVDYNAKVGGDKANLDGYISAISKGFIKGKLSMEEINPLLERNVKVFELLARETGGKYTAQQMQKMLQEGKLGRKAIHALLRGMGRDAKGAAKEQMKTWDGLVSNLEDTWTSMQARFMEHGAFDALKKELGGVLTWLDEKMEDGTLDEFAQTVSDTLITALNDLKDTAKEVQPILKSIGSVVSWVAEKAGGYGNILKFVAALYAANKVARVGVTMAKAGLGFGRGIAGGAKGLYGFGHALFGRGKGKGGAVPDVAGGLGAMSGAQPVFVVNMPSSLGDMGGGRRSKKRRGTKRQRLPNRQNKLPKPKQPPRLNAPQKVNGVTNSAKNTAKSVTSINPPKVMPNVGAQQVIQGVKQATSALKNTTQSVAKNTTAMAKSATTTIARTASKALPMVGTGLALAEGAMVLMDDEASVAEKSESVGSIAGATAGAIIGQALIPIPVVGAAIGGFLGETIGSWFGNKVGEQLEDSEKKDNAVQGTKAVADKMGAKMNNFVNGVGKEIAAISPMETKLDGAISVNVKLSDGLIANVSQTQLKTNQNQHSLQLRTEMGYSGVGLYRGA